MASSSEPIRVIATETDLNAWLLTDIPALHVLFVYADFHAPSKPGGQMDIVVQALAKIHPTVKFCKLNAEESSDIAEQFDVRPGFFFQRPAIAALHAICIGITLRRYLRYLHFVSLRTRCQ